MVKFPEADARMFKNKFVCRKCKSTRRANMMKILAGKVKCRSCDGSSLRVKRKK